MKRDFVCRLRLIIDQLPRGIRESYFLFLIAKFIFRLPHKLFTFRQDYNSGKIKDLSLLYEPSSSLSLERTSKDTDINSKHLKIIYEYMKVLSPKSVLDVGCGTGFLLKTLDSKLNGCEFSGIDFNCSRSFKSLNKNRFNFTSGDVNNILKSLKTNSFEIVICAHVLEHLSKPKDLILEMRRIAKKRLILICPLEKPYKWGLNYHVQFFKTSNEFIQFARSENYSKNLFNHFERLGDCLYIEQIES